MRHSKSICSPLYRVVVRIRINCHEPNPNSMVRRETSGIFVTEYYVFPGQVAPATHNIYKSSVCVCMAEWGAERKMGKTRFENWSYHNSRGVGSQHTTQHIHLIYIDIHISAQNKAIKIYAKNTPKQKSLNIQQNTTLNSISENENIRVLCATTPRPDTHYRFGGAFVFDTPPPPRQM